MRFGLWNYILTYFLKLCPDTFKLTMMFFLSGLLCYTTAAARSTDNCNKSVKIYMTGERMGTHRCRSTRKNKWEYGGW